MLKLTSDTAAGKVLLDDTPFELDGAQWTADHLAAGAHQLKFAGPQTEASFAFTAEPGTVPVISGPVSAKGVHAVVVSNSANHLHVYYSDSHAKVSLDGQPEVEIGNDGVDIPNVVVGPHQLSLSQGSDRHNVAVDVGVAPYPGSVPRIRSGYWDSSRRDRRGRCPGLPERSTSEKDDEQRRTVANPKSGA
jgi:hypothetical protein